MKDITIRPMEDHERAHVRAMMRRVFPIVEQILVEWTPNVLVAERDQQLLGAVVLKLFALPRNRKGGTISWIFTVPEARGQGLGQSLVEAGLDFLECQGCDEIVISVEGFNTSSSKLFSTRDFGIISPGEQFRRYGLATFALWAKLFHYFEMGYFLWARPAPVKADSSILQWWGTIAMNTVIGFLMLWRLSSTQTIEPAMWLMLAPTIVVLFGLRHLGMRLAASIQGLNVRFRPWESGFPLSMAIVLFSGAMYPIPGGVYPATFHWRYRDCLPKLGRVALAGTFPVLMVMWAVWATLQLEGMAFHSSTWLNVIRWIGQPLVLFDIAMPFFPFLCFNGRCLWDWHKPIWALMAAAAIALSLL